MPGFVRVEVTFELEFIDAREDWPLNTQFFDRHPVTLASRASFLLQVAPRLLPQKSAEPSSGSQKGQKHNSAVIALRYPLDGPQDVELKLIMRIHHDGVLAPLTILVLEGRIG